MPSWSTTSKAAVFCPSSRNGFTEFTSVTGCRSAIRRTIVSAWSKLPSTVRTFAPWIAACESLPRATEPFGTITKARIPARAANAAAEAEVLPVEAQITARGPALDADRRRRRDVGQAIDRGERLAHVALTRLVRQHDDGNGLARPAPLLDDVRDRDVVVPEDPRDLREHAGPVLSHHAQVITA